MTVILDGGERATGPFAGVGWMPRVQVLIQSAVGSDPLLDDIHQVNFGDQFALISFRTGGGQTVWFKATGAPNTHELPITKRLAGLAPDLVPRMIATWDGLNAWLMSDAGQPPESWVLQDLEQAAIVLAELQRRTVGSGDDFRLAGASDLRTPTLRAALPEAMEYLAAVMSKQESTRAPRVSRDRLRELECLLRDASFLLDELNIPDALLHNDVNSGNILFSGSKCVFTDWCEAGFGNPFFTFQHLARLQPDKDRAWNPQLRSAYAQSWLGFLTEAQIQQAFVLTPPLAIFSHFLRRGDWLRSTERNNPSVESFARSLARHMDRAAREPEWMEAVCR